MDFMRCDQKNIKSPLIFFILLSFIIAGTLLLRPLLAPVQAESWFVTTADNRLGDVGLFSAITEDPSGNYIISFTDNTNGDLRFAKSINKGETWPTRATIDSVNVTGYYTSIAADSDGNYMIVYLDTTAQDIKLIKSTDGGSTWPTKTNVQTAYTVGDRIRFMLDNDENYIVSFADSDAHDLRFTKSTDGGATWPLSVAVDSGGIVGEYSSLDVDPDNNYIISYQDSTNTSLKFAKSTDGGTTWPTIVTVDNAAEVGRFSSIHAVSATTYIISYFDGDSADLKFAKSTDGGATWPTVTVIDSADNVGGQSSISVDAEGNYVVAYYDTTNGNLNFATSTDGGATWPDITVVDSSGDVGNQCRLFVDSANNFLISYYDTTNTNLKFAKYGDDITAPSISLNPLAPDPNTDTTPSFTGTATETWATIASVQYQIDSTAGTWNDCSPVDGTFDSTSEDFQCDVTSPVSYDDHTVYVRASNSDGTFTSPGSETTDDFNISILAWASTTIDDGNVGIYTSITTDSLNNYLISYRDLGNTSLMFTKSEDLGETWSEPLTIDETDNVGRFTSIAVDEEDNYLIAYQFLNVMAGTGTLRFAKSTDGGSIWNVSVIDESNDAGYNNSLKVSPIGDYVVAYQATDGLGDYFLELAKSTDGGENWNLTTVDADGDTGYSPSLAIDSDGNYLIAYQRFNDGTGYGEMLFAKSDDGGSSWDYAEVDVVADQDTGYYPSIVVDGSGNYVIAYQNYDSSDWESSVKIAKSTDGGATWNDMASVESGAFGTYIAMSTDSLGNYLVAYSDDTLNDLKFARSLDAGSTWSDIWDIDGPDDAGGYPSVAVDAFDNYLVSYYDASVSSLKFAKLKTDALAPDLSLTVYTPDPGTDNTPQFQGSASDAAHYVSGVEFQIDDTDAGGWLACTADDGAFDELNENFSCTVGTVLDDGSHTVYVRATDYPGNVTEAGQEVSDTFVIDTVPPVISTLGDGNQVDGDVNDDGDVVITVKPEDTGSGVANVEFFIDGQRICNETVPNGDGIYTCVWDTMQSDFNVTIRVHDEAGNVTEIARSLSVTLARTGEMVLIPTILSIVVLISDVLIGKRKSSNYLRK